ncbi:MAG: 23S rRNA (uracil(1939)-C(5))-methyltransferase RlmD [Gammaproteobacteria bacterium]|nr:23S rRNA (uracil(1939)-C(5))-methyltransferase RlmD [Gammaproteobacteria bacterium]
MPQTIITSLSHEGRGIASINGKTCFISDALPEEEVNFDYVKKHRNYDEGKATEILKAAKSRVEPACAHFAICGGCSLQHLKHAEQITFKETVLKEQLLHFGGIEVKTTLLPILGPIYGYRSRARLSVKYLSKKNTALVGFHEKNGSFVANIDSCKILAISVGEKILHLRELIAKLSILQHIPQIEVIALDNSTALTFRHLQPFSQLDITMLKEFGKNNDFQIYLQPAGNASVHSIFTPSNNENAYLSYKLADHNIEILFKPNDFTQINQAVNQQMVARALELLNPEPTDSILDLFCGLGNFTLPLAKKCAKIIGIEGNHIMVEQATQNAKHNAINNAEFHAADLTKELLSHNWSIQKFNKILLDPPRTGALEICQQISKFNAKVVCYVSCNPATLARDAKELLNQGYSLDKIGIIDMFPHTSHVETIASFSK